MMSGDLKWNKIKEIEKELEQLIDKDSWIVCELDEEELGDIDLWKERCEEINCYVWELANMLYDIATEGCCLHHNRTTSLYPQHWNNVINKIINEFSEDDSYIIDDEDYYVTCLEEIDYWWQHHDYLNS